MHNSVFKNKLVLFILVFITLIFIHFYTVWQALHGQYYPFEHDAYLHMVFALDRMNHPHWYASIYPLINAPYGADTHAWTQVTMVILLLGAYFLHIFLPLKSALYWWCFFVPLVFKIIAIFALIWAAKPLQRNRRQGFFIALLFLCNPFLYHVYMPLRVDYDFLLVTISLFFWGCLLRLIKEKTYYWALLCALLAALGLWTSITFTIPLFIGMAFLFWLSLVQEVLCPKKVYLFFGMMCLFCLLILPLEHRYIWEISYDVLSIVYLSFYSLALIAIVLYMHLKKRSNFWNLVSALLLIGLVFFAMNYYFPGFYLGPYKSVNPFLLSHFFPTIYEFQSPLVLDNRLFLACSCYMIIGIVYCYYLKLNKELTSLQKIFLGITILLTLFSLYMFRWERLTAPLTLVPVAFFLSDYSQKKTNLIIKIILIMLVLSLPVVLYNVSPDPLTQFERECQEQMSTMIEDKFLDSSQFSKDKSVLVIGNYAPLILFYTHLGVIATNDHHNPQGYQDLYNFFYQDEKKAKKIIINRATDLILLCKKTHTPIFNPNQSNWLQPIPLPKAYSNWSLYRRRKS